MKKLCLLGVALAIAGTASAAPNVTNVTQKGSLLIFPDIRVDAGWNTLVRIQNDGSSDVDILCYWMDGNKNRVDIIFTLTRNQPFWFDAATGRGTNQVNRFPTGPANGIDNPFLDLTGKGAYQKGMLACWAVDQGAQNQVKWNHISGTATVYGAVGAYEYNAYAFYVPTGIDLQPVGVAGTLNLNGVEYDSCPLYMIGQFSPAGAVAQAAPLVVRNRLAVTGCTLALNQDATYTWTKLQFDIWNGDEVKFTGAFECADSWHETEFNVGTVTANGLNSTVFTDGIDSAAQNFDLLTLGTYAARYRVQGVKSSQCDGTYTGVTAGGVTTAASPSRTIATSAVGLVAVQSSDLAGDWVGSTLAAAGKFTGKITWDPEGSVPEGGIR